MNVEKALAIIDSVLEPEHLSDLQELVFVECWAGKTYQQIASEAGYDHDYIRGVGFQVWQRLSKAFGKKITKNNFHAFFRQYANQQVFPRQAADSSNFQPNDKTFVLPELPEGPVNLDSPFYIERPPIEQQCYSEILKPGALIRIRAANRRGKTSLKNRIIAHAQTIGYRLVRLNFEQADQTILSNLNQFLRWFSANISRQLGLETRLDDYWDVEFGSKVSCTIYFQYHILENIDAPLVLALDEVNRLFEYPEIAQNFLPLLRSWYEEGRALDVWQKLRLVVVHSTEMYLPLNINQSPFNVGFSVRLPAFTPSQVQELAQRHQLYWFGIKEVEKLMAIVGGHPYLTRLAFYHLAQGKITLEHLLEEATSLEGIYGDILRQHWRSLQQYPELMETMKRVISPEDKVSRDIVPIYKLESMGLIELTGQGAIPSCELYRLHFGSLSP